MLCMSNRQCRPRMHASRNRITRGSSGWAIHILLRFHQYLLLTLKCWHLFYSWIEWPRIAWLPKVHLRAIGKLNILSFVCRVNSAMLSRFPCLHGRALIGWNLIGLPTVRIINLFILDGWKRPVAILGNSCKWGHHSENIWRKNVNRNRQQLCINLFQNTSLFSNYSQKYYVVQMIFVWSNLFRNVTVLLVICIVLNDIPICIAGLLDNCIVHIKVSTVYVHWLNHRVIYL